MSQEIVWDHKLESLKNFAWWFYIFHAISLLFTLGALSFIPLLLNYLKRKDAANTFVYSHHQWQISSFWIYLLCVLIGWVLLVTIVGAPLAVFLWLGAWVWKAYRLIVGIMALNDNRPIGKTGQ